MYEASLIFLLPVALISFVVFFIFASAVAVYLKIFIQKGSGSKDFIASKYMDGISTWQFKNIRWFYITYDFLMLIILSLLTYTIPAMILGFYDKPYVLMGLFFLLIFLLTVIIPLDELKGITKLKWSLTARAPQGMLMIWQDRSKFGFVYNFFTKSFVWVLLLLIVILAYELLKSRASA